uniref:Uncharacterized protein n=1 Tax=Plectus sambesii TaxID=2011161 RepID=A0A914WR86_9BILA
MQVAEKERRRLRRCRHLSSLQRITVTRSRKTRVSARGGKRVRFDRHNFVANSLTGVCARGWRRRTRRRKVPTEHCLSRLGVDVAGAVAIGGGR